MKYEKLSKLSIRSHPELSERWVQERIAEDPSILGLAQAYLGAQGARLDVVIFPAADHTFRLRPAPHEKFEWPRTVAGYPDRVIEWVSHVMKP